jgi:ribose transport system substrate-binding protein
MIRATFFLALVTFGVSSCGKEKANSSSPPTASKGTIGLSVLTLSNPFFKVISETMTAEGKKHGYEVVTVSGEFKPETQRDQVRDFIIKKCAAIVLTPCDSKAVGTAIAEANAAGIPVFTADIKSLAEGPKVVSHIATDNLSGGREAAKAMIEALGASGGKVAIIHHPMAESCLLRVRGFREVVDAHSAAGSGARIEIVTELAGGGGKEGSFKAAEDALQAHPDLAGIFAINDPSALGARAALEKASRTAIKIVGFDGQPDGKQAIKEGKIYADPVQSPEEIGRQTMDAIVKHFGGEPVPPEVLIPTTLYRQADAANDPALK